MLYIILEIVYCMNGYKRCYVRSGITAVLYKKVRKENITSFNSRSNLISGLSEPYRLIASAYVSLGKGFGSWTPLISRKTCNIYNFLIKAHHCRY